MNFDHEAGYLEGYDRSRETMADILEEILSDVTLNSQQKIEKISVEVQRIQAILGKE